MHIHVQAVKIRSDHGYPLGIPPLSVNQLIPRTVQERLVAASKRLGSLYGRGRVVSRTRQGWHAPPLANSKWGVWLDLIPSTPLSHSLSLLSITANAPLHRPLSPPVPPQASVPRLVTAFARRPRRQSLTDKCYPVTRGRGEWWLSGLVKKIITPPNPLFLSSRFHWFDFSATGWWKLNRNRNFSNFFFWNRYEAIFKLKLNNFDPYLLFAIRIVIFPK